MDYRKPGAVVLAIGAATLVTGSSRRGGTRRSEVAATWTVVARLRPRRQLCSSQTQV